MWLAGASFNLPNASRKAAHPICTKGSSAMSIPDEIDELVLQLGASLAPPQYDAFVTAAHAALADVPCLGPGSAFRVLAVLQKRFFIPPPDVRYANLGARHYRPSKLRGLAAVGRDDPRVGGRDRHRLKVAG